MERWVEFAPPDAGLAGDANACTERALGPAA